MALDCNKIDFQTSLLVSYDLGLKNLKFLIDINYKLRAKSAASTDNLDNQVVKSFRKSRSI